MTSKQVDRLEAALKSIANYVDKKKPKNSAEAQAMLDAISVVSNEAITDANDLVCDDFEVIT
jgi:hypothetical protein